MSRITMAFRCFFRLAFSGALPAEAVDFLPESARPALPEPGPRGPGKAGAVEEGVEPAARESRTAGPTESKKPPAEPAETRSKPAESGPASSRKGDHHRDGALAFLALLQREGRLLDFLRESIDDYEDSDIGAAVRDIHRGCRKVIEEHLAMEPVMPGEEEEEVTVPKGFDPGEIRLVGELSGAPPFKGVLRHHGWRVTRASLPTLSEGVDRHVLAPAEVEVS